MSRKAASPVETARRGADTLFHEFSFLDDDFRGTAVFLKIVVLLALLVQRRGGPVDANYPSRVPDRHKVRTNTGRA